MYHVSHNNKFKSAYKRVSKSGNFKRDEYRIIIKHLSEGKTLPTKYYDHALKGNLLGQRECHIDSDTLLIYEIDLENKKIILANIGNHAQVFE